MEDRSPSQDSTQPAFWSTRYADDRTPWVLPAVPFALKAFLERKRPRGSVLIPGCGTDPHAVQAFHAAGYTATLVDFSSVAVEKLRSALNHKAARIILSDFFAHDFGTKRFDVIYERTFLCALSPTRWSDYVERIAALLAPGGLLAGFFFYGKEPDPPPYPLSEQTAAKMFGNRFRLTRSDTVADSLPMFVGREKWQEWELV